MWQHTTALYRICFRHSSCERWSISVLCNNEHTCLLFCWQQKELLEQCAVWSESSAHQSFCAVSQFRRADGGTDANKGRQRDYPHLSSSFRWLKQTSTVPHPWSNRWLKHSLMLRASCFSSYSFSKHRFIFHLCFSCPEISFNAFKPLLSGNGSCGEKSREGTMLGSLLGYCKKPRRWNAVLTCTIHELLCRHKSLKVTFVFHCFCWCVIHGKLLPVRSNFVQFLELDSGFCLMEWLYMINKIYKYVK